MNSTLYDELWDRVTQYSDAILLTLEGNGTLRSDQLEHLYADDATLWFFAAPYQPCLRNIEASPEICINYSDERHNELASLSGAAIVVRDPAVKQAQWAALCKRGSPNLRSWQQATLVRVAVDYAEYWQPHGNQPSRLSASQLLPQPMISRRVAQRGMYLAFRPDTATATQRV